MPLQLPGQFLDVLQLKVTDQANRRSLAARFRLDLQGTRRFFFQTAVRESATRVPKEFVEWKRDRLRQKTEISGFPKVR